MKTKPTLFKAVILSLIFSLMIGSSLAQTGVNGEILADTNKIVVLKVWGTHYERGYAHGYLIGDKILEVVNSYLKPRFGNSYPTARALVTDGQNLVLDSIYHVEAKAMIEGMGDAGYDTTNIDYIDLLVGASFSDLYGYALMLGPADNAECSTFLNWGDATAGTDLDGKSVVTRFYDWGSVIQPIVNNAVIIIHVPSEEGLQPWLLAGYAGEMVPSGGGLNQGGISVYKNGMSDFPDGLAVMGAQYEPYQITMRKALEIYDYNSDGANNTLDVRDALNSNPQGYPTGHIVTILARYNPESDFRTAMIAEIAPIAPTHVYRTNTYNDTIPGDNLYAANSQIKRNDSRNYCARYYNVLSHMGDGTGIGSEDNWEIMTNYSLAGVNYGAMQHIPDLDILKLSVWRNNLPAYQQEPTTFHLREFFNRPPGFVSEPVTEAYIGREYVYEIAILDPDPYDSVVITAWQKPDWLTLVDNGDGTALLSGIPDDMGSYTVKLKVDDGLKTDIQVFVIHADITALSEITASSIHLYPNPFKDYLYVNSDDELDLSIYSISGELVSYFRLKNPKNGIDLSDLPNGLYFFRLQVGNEVVTKKIVKL